MPINKRIPTVDAIDRKILSLLQTNAGLAINDIATRVGLSQTPCWKRIQKMEQSGVIKSRVAVLDAKKLNLGLTVFVILRTNQHDDVWLQKFARAVKELPEVTAIWRMAGDIDYLLRVVVKDIDAYDAFYKRLIKRVALNDVSSTFVMEEIKYTTALPLDGPEPKPMAA
jgi:Lrp/AsnC family transcriptional regulator